MKISFLAASLAAFVLPLHAAKMQVAPAAPQPGDVLALTIYPENGERISAVGMNAFDTENVKFFARPDGSARAFVGLPFDRKGGKFPISARVQTQNGEQIVNATVNAVTRRFPEQHLKMGAAMASTMSKKEALRREKLYVQSKMRDTNAGPLWSGNWMIPTPGRSSSAYGRKRWVNGKWWGQHNGADIKAGTGAPIYATNSGRVVLSENLPTLRGQCTVIDHGCNIFSLYFHQSQRLVKEGQMVKKGQLIGKVGATGFVTGPHLHWEIRIGWEPVDPFKVAKSGLNF
jgi:murein DD-endopeptidase MepM/ murein hydrolase activator NlpD